MTSTITRTFFVDGGVPLTMAVNHGWKLRFLLVPRPDGRPGHYGLPHFGSEEERQCDAFMIARAAESDESRAQLEEWNKLLELKPTDNFTELGGID